MNVKSYTDGYYKFFTMEIDHLKKESDMLVDAIGEVDGLLSQPVKLPALSSMRFGLSTSMHHKNE